jgi:sugar phosphate isomerase/epimerase
MRNKLFISAEKEFDEFILVAKERNLGFEIQEFYLPHIMEGNWKKRLDEYKNTLRNFNGDLSIHNAARNLSNISKDPQIVAMTKRKYDFHFMVAKELGAKIIVSHSHWLPEYRDIELFRWQENQVKFWEHYVNVAEKEDLFLVIENEYDTRPEILKAVIDKMNSTRFKFLFDPGHANLFSEVPIEEWIMAFSNCLVYIHANNNYNNYDQHNSVLKGTINFDNIFNLLEKLNIEPIFCTEVYSKEALLESLDYLEEKMKNSDVYR